MLDPNMAEKLLSKNTILSFNTNSYYKIQPFFFLKSLLIQKLINILTKGGKKIKAELLVVNYLKFVKKKKISNSNSIISFFSILETSKSSIGLLFVRKGKKVYNIPVPIRQHRQYLQTLRWIKLLLSKNKQSSSFWLNIFNEHMCILNDKSKSVLLKKKNQIFSLSVENRMFTHFRWY